MSVAVDLVSVSAMPRSARPSRTMCPASTASEVASSTSSLRSAVMRPERVRVALFDLTPLAHCPQHQNSHDTHAQGSYDGTDEGADSLGDVAITVALQLHQGVPDEPAGQAAEQDRDEGCGPSGGGGESREGPFVVGHGCQRMLPVRARHRGRPHL